MTKLTILTTWSAVAEMNSCRLVHAKQDPPTQIDRRLITWSREQNTGHVTSSYFNVYLLTNQSVMILTHAYLYIFIIASEKCAVLHKYYTGTKPVLYIKTNVQTNPSQFHTTRTQRSSKNLQFDPHTVLINKSFNCSRFVKMVQNYRGHQLECNYQIIIKLIRQPLNRPVWPCLALNDLDWPRINFNWQLIDKIIV